MIYATRSGITTVVGAADDIAELEAFFATASITTELFDRAVQPSISDMMMEDRWRSYTKPPYVFDHASEKQATDFLKKFALRVVPENVVADKHKSMLRDAAAKADQYLETSADQRTLGEIYGLTSPENDKWDTRTPEQIAQEEEYKKQADAAKKQGKLGGESFAPPKSTAPGSQARVTDIRTVQRTDGVIEIDNVLAVKGLHDKSPDEGQLPPVEEVDPDLVLYRFSALPANKDWVRSTLTLLAIDPINLVAEDAGSFTMNGEKHANKMCGSLDRHEITFDVELVDSKGIKVGDFERNAALAEEIDPDGHIAIYYRVDLPANLAHVSGLLAAASLSLDEQTVARGETKDGSWLAVMTQAVAEKVEAALAGEEVEVYAVNDRGERLLPKGSGASIVDPNAVEVIPPRRWNAEAGELAAMNDEDRAANKKAMKAKEFLFCGRYRGAQDGCVVYICPETYFREHDVMYPDSLDIAHLLPPDLKEKAPGIYVTRSQGWHTLVNMLNGLGFKESFGMQLMLNNE